MNFLPSIEVLSFLDWMNKKGIVELKDAIDVGAQMELIPTIIGIIVAAVSGVACIKLLQWILKKDMWKYFGFYCLALGVVVLIYSYCIWVFREFLRQGSFHTGKTYKICTVSRKKLFELFFKQFNITSCRYICYFSIYIV